MYKSFLKPHIDEAKQADIYSMLLFVMFKTSGMKSFGALPELVFMLDKDNFLTLCEYFGGREIYIPTISELHEYLEALLYFKRVDMDHMDPKEAEQMIERGISTSRIVTQAVLKKYGQLKEVLDEYTFTKRTI